MIDSGPDLAVLGQDPRFRGGALALMEAFWNGATALGRTPEFFYPEHPSLRGVSVAGSPLDVAGLPPRFRHFDAGNHLAAARLADRLRDARSLWVVATAASHGYAALRSGRPYRAWLATGLPDEW